MARKCMSYYGWAVQDEWRWGQVGLGFTFSLLHDQHWKIKEQVEPLWREAFRHFHHSKWRLKSRRDSRQCRDCLYDAALCARERTWAAANRVSLMVLTGEHGESRCFGQDEG